jgi:hypothetical protein
MLFKLSILALVGGGDKPYLPPNKLRIWDDSLGKSLDDLTYQNIIRSVKLRKDMHVISFIVSRIVVATECNVFVYGFVEYKTIKTLDKFATLSNPAGLLALSSGMDSRVLAFPDSQPGFVRIINFGTAALTFQTKNRRSWSRPTARWSCIWP